LSFRACTLVLLLLSPIAFLIAGGNGWAAYLLGAGTSTLNLWAWYALIGLAGRVSVETESPRGGTLLVFLAFLMKLPVVVALYYAVNRVGGGVSTCFLTGTLLVYLALAGWALGKSQKPTLDSNGRPY